MVELGAHVPLGSGTGEHVLRSKAHGSGQIVDANVGPACSTVTNASAADGVVEADNAAVGAGAVTVEASLIFLVGERIGDLAGDVVTEIDDGIFGQLAAVPGQHAKLLGY